MTAMYLLEPRTLSKVGPIWGDVTTNGGNVTHSGYQISGTIDNNVPFTIPPLPAPDTTGYHRYQRPAPETITANSTSESSSNRVRLFRN